MHSFQISLRSTTTKYKALLSFVVTAKRCFVMRLSPALYFEKRCVPRASGAVAVVALRDGVVVADARLDDHQRAEVGVLLQGAVVQLQVAVVQVLQKGERRRIAQRAVTRATYD